MQPSASVPLKPGLERAGLPWGRDLFTFVTSAAGHVMRILQKPRKKRPSKRQVNHRRFLHNMIQRKFADIEAANHRLASALFSTEQENKVPSLSVREEQSHSASRGASQTQPEADTLSDALKDTKRLSKSGSDFSHGSPDPTEGGKKNRSNSGQQWTLNPKCQSDALYTPIRSQDKGTHKYAGRMKKGSGGDRKLVEIPEHVNVWEEHFQTAGHCYGHENPPEAANNRPPQSSLCCSWTEWDSLSKIIPPSHHNLDITGCDSPCLSLELSLSLSPLSLESCDFSLQMDIPACSPQPKKDAEAHCVAEAQHHQHIMDEMYPLESDVVGDGDSACPCADSAEGYVDSVRGGAYRVDGGGTYWGGAAGGTASADDDNNACPEQPEIFAVQDKMILVHRSNGEVGRSSEGNYGYGRGGGGGGGRDHGDVVVGETLCYQEQHQGNSHCRMQASERQEEPTEIDFSCFEPSSAHCEGVAAPNQLQSTYRYDVPPETTSSCMYQVIPRPRQRESCFMALGGGVGTPPKNVSFEGVAQSFSVPPRFSSSQQQQHPVLSLPLLEEEDWLFTDILQDRKSP